MLPHIYIYIFLLCQNPFFIFNRVLIRAHQLKTRFKCATAGGITNLYCARLIYDHVVLLGLNNSILGHDKKQSQVAMSSAILFSRLLLLPHHFLLRQDYN